jgi:hypothetical protein
MAVAEKPRESRWILSNQTIKHNPMKKLLSLLIAAGFCANSYAQCTPDAAYLNSNQGIYPDSLTFLSPNGGPPCGQDFSTTLTMKTWVDSSIVAVGQPVVLTFDATEFVSISGLPPGFNVSADGSTWNANDQTWYNQGIVPNISSVLGCLNIQASFADYQAASQGLVYVDYPLLISFDQRVAATSIDLSFIGIGPGSWMSDVPLAVGGGLKVIDDYVLRIGYAFGNERICLVTVDSITGFNSVKWEKNSGIAIDYFNVHKQNSITSQYDSIGWVPYDSLSVFIDVNSNPAQGSNRYSISEASNCGSSPLSPVHRTIHLASNQGINGEVNLSWNGYEGFSYANFEVYRSNNGGPYSLISNVANNDFTYTDLTPPTGANQYRIAVVNPNGCTPTRALAASFSNSTSNFIVGLNSVFQDRQVEIYPNPANGFYNLLLEQLEGIVTAKVYDAQGREVWANAIVANGARSQHSIDLSTHAKGIYTLQLQTNQGTITRKLVKN